MFQFPALASRAYGFSAGYPPVKRGGFPHWDIPGSKPIWRLPEAYRSLSRPSSPLTAKASTTHASLLDHITMDSARPKAAGADAPLLYTRGHDHTENRRNS